MFVALLDTCVLWPSLQRDFLLSLSIEGCFRPIWSEAILTELEFHESEKLVRRGTEPAFAAVRAASLIERMRTAFSDAVVTGWEPLDGTFDLPDRDDEHVLAAAHVGGASVIVTLNLKDFPRSRVPAALEVLAPAEFVHDTVVKHPEAARHAIGRMAARTGMHGPARSPEEVVNILSVRYGMHEAATVLRMRSQRAGSGNEDRESD